MSLLERDPLSPRAMVGELPVSSRYSAGIAGERFFRAIKDEGRILGTYCETCDITYVPGRIFCERCFDGLDDWRDVGIQGEVHTFTLLFENLDHTHRENPAVIAFIKIADGGLIHELGEVDLADLTIGMSVEAVFKPQADREGSIKDIKYFRPLST